MGLSKNLYDSIWDKLKNHSPALAAYVKGYYDDSPVAHIESPWIGLARDGGSLNRITMGGLNGGVDERIFRYVIMCGVNDLDNPAGLVTIMKMMDDLFDVLKFETFQTYGGNADKFYEPVSITAMDDNGQWGDPPFAWGGAISIEGRVWVARH